jgi:hypothetical protein
VPGPIRRFNERLSPRQRVGVGALAVLELAAKVAAARDIQRRPEDQIRGKKTLWRLALLVNTFGPLSYFLWGPQKDLTVTRRPIARAEPAPHPAN